MPSCHVSQHAPVCMCEPGFSGDPFTGCYKILETPIEVSQPCRPSPCGLNALCEERNRAAACKCLPEYFGDPYTECRPECVINSDCPKSRACVNQRCVDPCPGMCGHSALCAVFNHAPNCECLLGYTGTPLSAVTWYRDATL
ncbi:GL19750 [Drosophila persimilis]|uniref:GL19750 n=1 Tax=Drosophila persimilis TaxID=7234 RepID=B4IS52_DROPE|nr:GL19750 [Drosophila persimilis]